MKITRQEHGSVVVLSPHGPLTSDELPDLQREIEAALSARTSRAVVDMADVPYVDGKGIEAVLALGGSSGTSMRRVKIAALSDCVRVALDVTDVLPRLEVYDTVNDAIRGCRK